MNNESLKQGEINKAFELLNEEIANLESCNQMVCDRIQTICRAGLPTTVSDNVEPSKYSSDMAIRIQNITYRIQKIRDVMNDYRNRIEL